MRAAIQVSHCAASRCHGPVVCADGRITTGTGGCDETGQPPSECDARCGVVYVDYFARCESAIRDFLPDQYSDFQRLEQTCTQVSGTCISRHTSSCISV